MSELFILDEMKMRRILIVITLTMMSVACFAGRGSDAVRQDKLLELIREYSDEDGFDVVQIGALGTSAIKNIVRMASSVDDDPDLKDAMKIIRGIRKIAVVDYEDCLEEARQVFDKRLGKLLDNCDMLLETKDSEDSVRMYGVIDDDSEEVNDFIMYIPSDSKLICLFGTIKLDAVVRILEE